MENIDLKEEFVKRELNFDCELSDNVYSPNNKYKIQECLLFDPYDDSKKITDRFVNYKDFSTTVKVFEKLVWDDNQKLINCELLFCDNNSDAENYYKIKIYSTETGYIVNIGPWTNYVDFENMNTTKLADIIASGLNDNCFQALLGTAFYKKYFSETRNTICFESDFTKLTAEETAHWSEDILVDYKISIKPDDKEETHVLEVDLKDDIYYLTTSNDYLEIVLPQEMNITTITSIIGNEFNLAYADAMASSLLNDSEKTRVRENDD